MMRLFEYIPGDAPVLLNIPHSGTFVPPEIGDRFTTEGAALADTDWHVEKLYDFAVKLRVHILFATHSRYVVDLNRDPSGTPIYPGADNTEICPTTTFGRAPIYRSGEAPTSDEVKERVDSYWQPYHAKLAEILETLKENTGRCVLFDAHSIPSQVPRFFEGTLPHLNLGTAGGKSASADLIHRVMAELAKSPEHTAVLDGRFQGGFITRHYGRPEDDVHALQLEMAQSVYMDEVPPHTYHMKRVKKIRPILRNALAQCVVWSLPRPNDTLPMLVPS